MMLSCFREDEPVKGSRASLTSTIKLDSDDEGSLNEYGDIDTGKFNEDGSFIGLYEMGRNSLFFFLCKWDKGLPEYLY